MKTAKIREPIDQPKPAQCLATTPKNTHETTRNCSIHRQERNRKRLRKGRAKRRSKQLSGSPSAVRESIVSGRRWLRLVPIRSTLLWSPRPWLCVARTLPLHFLVLIWHGLGSELDWIPLTSSSVPLLLLRPLLDPFCLPATLAATSGPAVFPNISLSPLAATPALLGSYKPTR